MPVSFDSTDLNNAASESGVVHESVASTDHDNASVLKQGYSIQNPYASSALTAYYPFQEDSGTTAYDYSGNNNDATNNGATTNKEGILDGSAYGTDGNNDYIDTGLTDPPMESGDATYLCWLRIRDTSASGPIYRQEGSHSISYNQNGVNEFQVATWGGNTGAFGPTITDNNWHQIAIERDGEDFTIYENGTSVETALGGTPDSSSNPLRIGGYSAGAGPPIDICEVRLCNRKLTGSEIQDLYDVVATQGELVTSSKVA